MRKLRNSVMLSGVLGTVAVSALSLLVGPGCSGDDTTPITPADASRDQTTRDTGSPGQDSGPTPDSTVVDTGGGTDAGGGNDASDGATPNDGAVNDGSVNDGNVSDGGTADADASVVCVTNVASLAANEDGGLYDGGVPQLLFSGFDNMTAAMGWKGADNMSNAVGTTQWTGAQGKTCPGAVQFEYAFPTATKYVELVYTYPGSPPVSTWVTPHHLHFWAKVVFLGGDGGAVAVGDPDYNYLNYVGSYVQWAGYSITAGGVAIPASQLTGGAWREGYVDLTKGGTAIEPSTDTSKIAIQLTLQAPAGVDAGAPTPTAVLYLDDLWIE